MCLSKSKLNELLAEILMNTLVTFSLLVFVFIHQSLDFCQPLKNKSTNYIAVHKFYTKSLFGKYVYI